jgi:hypothetical protein
MQFTLTITALPPNCAPLVIRHYVGLVLHRRLCLADGSPPLAAHGISRRSEGVSTPSACGWAGRAQPLCDVLASARRSSSPLRVDILLAL